MRSDAKSSVVLTDLKKFQVRHIIFDNYFII